MYLCDFHREQAWDRWLSSKDNDIAQAKDVILSKLRAMARAPTEDAFDKALAEFCASPEYKMSLNLRTWFTNKWFPEKHVCNHKCYNRSSVFYSFLNVNILSINIRSYQYHTQICTGLLLL